MVVLEAVRGEAALEEVVPEEVAVEVDTFSQAHFRKIVGHWKPSQLAG